MDGERINSSFGNLEILPFNTGMNMSFIVISAVLVCTGLVGNIVTIVIIRIRDDFHNITYTAICLLAFTDLIAVCFRAIPLVFQVFIAEYFNWTLTLDISWYIHVFGEILITINCVTLICSSMHVVILVRLRYKLLAFPIEGLSIKNRPGCLFIRTFFTEEFL